jgi:hypothetical protein
VPFSSVPPAPLIASVPPVIAPVTPHLAVAPTEAPYQQVMQEAVPARRRNSPVGIAALGLGILAILIAWKPFFGLLAIPVGLLGGLLGIVGFVYGLVTKRCKILAAGVGLGLSLGSIILSVMMTGAGRAATAATKYNEKAVDQFVKLRESLRGIAAREGKMPTNEFTIEIINESAASKILTPEEYVAAKEAFLDYGGQYVSPTDEPGSRRIERATLNVLLPEMMGYAKMCKLSSRIVARFIAEMIKQMPKGSSADDYKRVFAGVVMVAVKNTGSAESTLAQLTPFLGEQVGEGKPFGGGEKGIRSASVFLMVQEYDHPGDSYTYSSAALRLLGYLHGSGLERELGINDDMTPEQKIGAIHQAWKKSGEKKLSNFLEPYTSGMGEMPANAPR